MSAPTWNDKFELPDGLYSTSDIEDYFEYIIKKHNVSLTNISSVNFFYKIENRITFKSKAEY